MESRGLVRRESNAHGLPTKYTLTEAGQELVPVVWSIGQWGARWLYTDPAEHNCDGVSLLWRMHRAQTA